MENIQDCGEALEEFPSAPQRTIQVSGFSNIDSDILEVLYMSSSITGGGPIEDIKIHTDSNTADIKFQNPDDAVRAVAQRETKVGMMLLIAVWPGLLKPNALSRMVKITGVEGIDRDTLDVLYSNRMTTGGGRIDTIDMNSAPPFALIAFTCHTDAAHVVRQRVTKFASRTLIASWPDQEGSRLQVEISGIYSIKTRSGGGPIEHMEMMNGKVWIQCKNPRDAANTVEMHEVILEGSIFTDCGSATDVFSNVQTARGSLWANDDVPFDMVVVGGLQGDEDEDILKMFLSSFKKCGGGPVKNIHFLPGSNEAFVTFQKPKDAARVASKQTVMFCGKKLALSAMNSVDSRLSCAITVSNLPPNASEDTLALIFEQEVIHGFEEECQEIVMNEEKGSAVVTMKSRKAVQNILDYHKTCPFTISRVNIDVHWLPPAPPGKLFAGPVEAHKILFRSIDANKNMEDLRSFLEEGARAGIDHIIFTPIMGVILVYFTEAVDFMRMKMKCISQPFKGKMIGLEGIATSSMVQIWNVTAALEDKLRLYLQHTCNGGRIVNFSPDKGYAIVEFQSPETVTRLCERKNHRWNLLIQEYNESVGLLHPEVDYSSPCAWLPKPLQIKWEAVYLGFVFSNARIKREIEEKMSRVWSEIIWPKDPNNAVISLKCVLDSMDSDFAVLMKRWQDVVTDAVRDVFDMIVFYEMHVNPAAREELCREARAVEQRNSDAQILYESDSCKLTVVGKKPDISQVYQQLRQIKEQVEYQIHVAENLTTKVVDKIEPAKLKVLEMEKWQENIEWKYRTIDITIERGNIVLKGLTEDIHDAYEETLEYLTKINNGAMKIDCTFQSVLQDAETQTFLQQMTSNLKVFWTVERGFINFWSVSRAQIDAAKQIINGQLKTEPIIIPRRCRLLSKELTLKDTLAKMERQESGALEIILDLENCEVRLVGITSCVDASKVQLQQLFKDHIVDDKKIRLPRGKVQFLQKYKTDEVIEIQKELSDYGVTITLNDCEVCISATEQGIERAEKKLCDLANRIVSKTKSIERPEVAEFLTSNKGKEELKLFENLHKVIVEMTYESYSRQPSRPLRYSPRKDFSAGAMSLENLGFELNGGNFKDDMALINAANEKGPNESWRCYVDEDEEGITPPLVGYVDEDEGATGNNYDVGLPQPPVGSGNKVVAEAPIWTATVQILSGHITAETTDAIVNTTDNKLQNKGRLSQAILNAAGEKVKKASMKLKFPLGNAMATDSGLLPCKKLIHTISGNDKESWKRSIGACLQEADHNGLRSISFPAMGTGHGQSPVCRQQMASWVVETWKKHIRKNPTTKLEYVHIVAMKDNLAKDYAQILVNKLGGGCFSPGRSLASMWFSSGSEPVPQSTRPRRSGERMPIVNTILILTFYEEKQNIIETFMEKIYDKKLFLTKTKTRVKYGGSA